VRVTRTVSPACLRRARLVSLFAFALIPAAFAPAQEAAPAAARAHLEKGRDLASRREYDQALAALDEALTLAGPDGDARLSGDIQMERGGVFFSQGDWTRMGLAYQAAADFFEKAGAFQAQARALRSLVYDPNLTWDRKEQLVEHAVDILRREPDPAVEARVLQSWGDILVNQGRYGRALDKLEQARAKLEGSNDEVDLARVLTSLGRALRLHGQPEEALPHYREALRMQTARQDWYGAAQSENAIAVAMRYLGRPHEALAHSVQAVALAERGGNPSQLAFNRLQLALFRADVGDYQGALRTFGMIGPALHPVDEPSRRTGLAGVEVRLGRNQEALAHAQEAVSGARQRGDPFHIVFALETRARALTAVGQRAQGLEDARESVSILEGLRSGLASQDQARQGFADAFRRVYSTAIVLLLRSGRDLEALEVAEKARARAFLDLLTTRDLPPTASDEARDAQRRQLAAADAISGQAMAATLTRLGSTLLAYWIGEEDVVVWVLSADGTVHARRLPVSPDHLRSLTRSMAAPAPAARPAGAEDPARAVYDELVRPIEAWLPGRAGSRITIVPHAFLFSLPFAALRDGQGRYLIERWAPHYATSMSVLDRLDARGNASGLDTLIVAEPKLDPRLVERDGLGPLPAAREEAEAVAHGLKAPPAAILSDSGATVAAVRQAIAGAHVVHFATHAVVSDTRPLESFLALAPDGGHDGRLTSAEIYGWRLKADLVVLSACRTARGRVNGDGVIGLSRAFAYAGTPSLVASVWDAPDQTSRELFPTFYAEWQRTGDRAGALRTAQLALIRRLRAGEVSVSTPAGPVTLQERPALWAPFVLLGEP
jgi:CHAT domain-containing protein